jgi:hypothetical protein
MASSAERGRRGLEALVRNRKPSAYVLLAVAALLAVATLWLGTRWRGAERHGEFAWLTVAAGLLSLVGLGAGLFQLLRSQDGFPEPDTTRLLVLAVGGLTGLVVSVTGLVLAWQWWDVYLAWLKGEEGAGGWKMWVSLGALFGGLAVMFAGLQLARTEERSNATLRRLLYGYNAFLAALLLLAVLAVGNVLAYVKFATPVDFTASSMYTLSSRSRNLLEGLDKPTRIYVLLTTGDLLQQEMQTLLTNCREVNDKIQVEYVSPDLDDQRVADLEEKYSFSGRLGVLVVSGTKGKDESHQFIPRNDLFTFDQARGKELVFKGEDALMTALAALSEGKSKPVLYFTQGHGELDLNDTDPGRIDQGCGILRRRLEKRNYDVKPLQFSPANPQVPDDAAVVVIARPSQPFARNQVQALRNYLTPPDPKKKKGKLLALFDVVLSPEGTMGQTGLEPLMAEFNVQVGNERILNLTLENPAQVLALMNPELVERNPLVRAFRRQPFGFYNARPVQPLNKPESAPPGRGSTAESLMLVPPSLAIWAEPNLRADAAQLAADLRANDAEIDKKVSRQPVPVAVVVTDPSASTDPHAFMRPPTEGAPRMAVFGDATFASNRFTNEDGPAIYYELIANTIDWLREKPHNIGIEPKNRNIFTLDTNTVDKARMILLPSALLFLAILGLGTGVWLVRRQ